MEFHKTALSNVGYVPYGYGRRLEPALDDVAVQALAVSRAAGKRLDGVITLKRAFDLTVACGALIVLSPMIAVSALLIKLESRGPVFFMQERIGLNRRRGERRRADASVRFDERARSDRRKAANEGRPFKMYKFRTMVESAEAHGPVLACQNDPRVTRFGRFMRKSRIDEIPQFINVIKGDMSIIGPRPERPYFINKVREHVPEFTMRLMVKPGITGLAQVENGYAKTLDEMRGKLSYDLTYIANLSLSQELKILCKTFHVVLTGKGAC
jgi:lipopolysaccharide/colanic/teichoic acid biosynthesis glycosyltransferase